MASYPLPKPVKPIGEPYQGTHAKAFNQKGGSDNWQSENAVDLPARKGTPVYAVADGTIGNRIGAQGGGRFAGLRVYVDTADNSYYYAHLSRLVVKAGQKVHAGQIIGYSGEANGVGHLHFAAKNGDPNQVLTGASSPPPGGTDSQPTSVPGATTQPSALFAPLAVPPPSDTGIGSSGVEMPGSQSYTIDPTHVVSLWQTVAGSDFVSPETQQLLQNAQLGSPIASNSR